MSEELFSELETILDHCTRSDEDSEVVESNNEWSTDLRIYTTAYVINWFGENVIGNSPSKILCEDRDYVIEGLRDVFPMPDVVENLPIEESETWWWDSVVDLVSKGDVIDDQGFPNLAGVFYGWEDRLEDKYMLSFSEEALEKVEESLVGSMSHAKNCMETKMEIDPVDNDVLRSAARMFASGFKG